MSTENTEKEPKLYYKGMLEDGRTRYGRSGWNMPKGKRPGVWMPKVKPVICSQGYHVCTIDQLRQFISPAIYVVEVRGKNHSDKDDTKSVWEQARLIRRIEGWDMDSMLEWAKKCADRPHPTTYAAAYAADAACAAAYAADAARAAAYATYAAAHSAIDAVHSAARAANRAARSVDAATNAAVCAANAAAYAARSTPYDNSVISSEVAYQTNLLKEMLGVDR